MSRSPDHPITRSLVPYLRSSAFQRALVEPPQACKKPEHPSFPGSLSLQEGKMAGQIILGETLLKQALATATDEPAKTVEALVADHALMVFRIAYSILRNHHDAEDAAQECFLRVVKFQKRLPQVRNPKTWLARIAWTTALDRRSGRSASTGREEVLEDDILAQLPDASQLPDESLGSEQMRRLLEKLIAGLPEELRQPLELSTVHE